MKSATVRLVTTVILTAILTTLGLNAASPAQAAGYVPISGAGSTWSQNALDQWRRNVDQFGIRVNYQGTGSSDGRNQFRNGTVDFAVSEIPYGLKDGNVIDQPPIRKYAYMPIVAGGTSLMYNLTISGKRVTNLRLSGLTVAKIFTGTIKSWNDPAIKADNPGLSMPARRIVPVVRSDGSGTTAQMTAYLAAQYPSVWNSYCAKAGRSTPCGGTSTYPIVSGVGFTAQAGSLGVSGYFSQEQNVGTITYVEYSYALNTGYPVAKLLNKAGYYVEPTPNNTAVGLQGVKINTNPSSSGYLTSDLTGVYNNSDPRTYPMSSYSYMIIPTKIEGTLNANKGKTLGAFAYYFLCEGQRQAPVLGYSPLPLNLVQAGLAQVRRIPGVEAKAIDIKKCNNPTFSSDGKNLLAKNAPQPQSCDKQGATQCATGTGGASKTSTSVSSSGSTSPSTTTGGSTGTSGTTGGTTTSGGTGQTTASGDSGQGISTVNGTAVTLPVSSRWGLEQAAMVFAAIALLVVLIAPPLVARRLSAGTKK